MLHHQGQLHPGQQFLFHQFSSESGRGKKTFKVSSHGEVKED